MGKSEQSSEHSAPPPEPEYYKERKGKKYTKEEWKTYKAGHNDRKIDRSAIRHKKKEAAENYAASKAQFEFSEGEFLIVFKRYFKKEEMTIEEMLSLLHQWKQDLVNHGYGVSVEMNRRKVIFDRPVHLGKSSSLKRAFTLGRGPKKGRNETQDTLIDRFDEMFKDLSVYINAYKALKQYQRDLSREDFNTSEHRATIMTQLNRRTYTPKELKEKERRKQQRTKIRAKKALIRAAREDKHAKKTRQQQAEDDYIYDDSSSVE